MGRPDVELTPKQRALVDHFDAIIQGWQDNRGTVPDYFAIDLYSVVRDYDRKVKTKTDLEEEARERRRQEKRRAIEWREHLMSLGCLKTKRERQLEQASERAEMRKRRSAGAA